ncbi:uncharacterized protein VTP21DRAFT_2108 [Calcarisporiella thermophila]|uniref:uncharacterized protein n=1 Tax=Calcarisporiella thermophila TaxID=911321 RepID=UPI00374492AE
MAENYELKDRYIELPPAPAPRAFADPAPLGLCGFALTTFVLSLYNAAVGIQATTPPNIVVGLAVFYGGLAQMLAGIMDFVVGNTFGCTAFISYGAFWLSYAVIQIPGTGVLAAYANVTKSELSHAVAIFLLGWTIFTGIMLIAAHRSNGCLVVLFSCLFLTFILLTAADFQESSRLKVAGGSCGIVTACIAWYTALGHLLTPQTSTFTLPMFPFRR